MRLSHTARQQIATLKEHYREIERPEAVRNLTEAVRQAGQQIRRGETRPAPLPYPQLKRAGLAWTHAGSYWFAVTTGRPSEIAAVFYDRADIPRRFSGAAKDSA